MSKEFKVRILNAKYVPQEESFILVVEDVETKKPLSRPLQVSKEAMLNVAGVDPNNPEIDHDLMHYYASQLKNRSKDNPLVLQDSDVDELSPFIESELDRMNKEDEEKYGQTMEEFKETLPKGIYLDTDHK